MNRRRTIDGDDQYSAQVVLHSRRNGWGWHIVRPGHVQSAGKTLPIQRSGTKYRTEEEAKAAADIAPFRDSKTSPVSRRTIQFVVNTRSWLPGAKHVHFIQDKPLARLNGLPSISVPIPIGMDLAAEGPESRKNRAA